MSVIHAIILGIIQGITEFLPVSSFGHLCALESVMHTARSSGVLFEVLLHVGTMAAVILVFLKDIRKLGIEIIGMIMDLVGNAYLYIYNRRTGKNLNYARIVHGTYRRLAVLILVSFIPTAFLGYEARRLVVRFAVSGMIPGIGMLLTGIILLVVDFSDAGGEKTVRETRYGDAMWMGICQGISVFPGFSRLGLTVSAGLFCGLSRKFAVKYSILMSIPAVIGAFFAEVGEFTSAGMTVGTGFIYILGMLFAGATGYLTIHFMMKVVNTVKFRYFAIYCFGAGLLMLVMNYV